MMSKGFRLYINACICVTMNTVMVVLGFGKKYNNVQFGFRKGVSTSDGMYEIVNQVCLGPSCARQ